MYRSIVEVVRITPKKVFAIILAASFHLTQTAVLTANDLNEGFDETMEVVGNALDWGIDYDK